jgi:hypothetical protein
MKLYVCIFDDARLLPHFLKHYARFGISEFHIAAPATLAATIGETSRGYSVFQYTDDHAADTVTGSVVGVTAMRAATQGADEWVVIVDLDEFVEFGEPVQQLAERAAAAGRNVVRGIMYDRLAANGQPEGFDASSHLPDVYPVRSRLTKELMGGFDIKGVLVKGHLKSRGAHHKFHDEKPLRDHVLEISHYKWTDRCLQRVRQAYDMASARGIEWAAQYKNVLDHYEAHGRLCWETFGGEIRPPGLADPPAAKI